MTRPARFAVVLATCAPLWPACGPGGGSGTLPTPLVGPPSSTLAPNGPPTASLSGIWAGKPPAAGMVVSVSGCGACSGAPFSAADVVLNISDSSHSLSGSATLTVREGGTIGEVIPASVTGSVGLAGRVTMQWNATTENGGPAPVALFVLEGVVSASRMSGTVILTGGGVSADGTWSVTLQ
jgi:hypothetical protein